MKESLLKKAKKSSAHAKCDKCPLFKSCNMLILTICNDAFVAGYMKGYKTAKKELKNN